MSIKYHDLNVGVTLAGEASGGPIEAWDFTSATPLVGTIRGIALTDNNMTYNTSGAVFNSDIDSLVLGAIPSGGFAFEVDVAAMNLPSVNSNQRFILGKSTEGLIYRSSHKWGFYGNGDWATDTTETAGDFFDGSTVRVEVDSNLYWHIYKDGVLWYEPNRPQPLGSVRLGSGSYSIQNATISAFRWI